MAIRYQLGKGFGGVAELTEVDRAISFVACRKQIVAARSVLNREVEFALGKVTASQALGSSNAHFTRCFIAVVKRHNCRFLRTSSIAAVHIGLAALRATRHNRGRRQRALRRITRNGNGHRAFCRVVGVATGCRALLSNLVGVGLLARVSLRYHGIASQRRHRNLHSIASSWHRNHAAFGWQVEQVCCRLIIGCDLNDELSIGHIATSQRLCKVQATCCLVVQLSGIAVHKRAILRGGRRNKLALAIVAYGYLDNGFIVAVVDTRQGAGGFSYLVGKGALMIRSILDHIGRELNLAKVERY